MSTPRDVERRKSGSILFETNHFLKFEGKAWKHDNMALKRWNHDQTVRAEVSNVLLQTLNFLHFLCTKSGFQNLHQVFPIESTNTLLSSVGCSFHSVTCVVLNIKHHSWNDFTTHNVFFSSGAPLLVLALFANYQIIPSTSAAPIDCQKNTAVCSGEIIKELTQVRFGIKILTENITLVRCKWDSYSNWTDYSILSLSLYCVAWKTVVLCMAISIPFVRNHFASLDDKISCTLGALIFGNSLFQLQWFWTLNNRIILNVLNFYWIQLFVEFFQGDFFF